ncbi:MAG: V-type ATP synthase subunit D [Gammaproteobacteria bacterium]
MPESNRELAISRVALLDLQDEQRLVREGYELLDEKRILLAAEIRRQLGRLRTWRGRAHIAEIAARAALMAALNRHGLDELSVYPPLPLSDAPLQFSRARLFGLELLEVHWLPSVSSAVEQSVNPTPEARACALAYRDWLALLAEIAACCVNLRRLIREYVRTERRARAVENVLLPEIDSGLKFIQEQLEGLDQEEIARLRQRRKFTA